MNDDQLKALRESLRISETEAIAIIDEALSRGAQRDGMATELERKSKDLRAWEIDARTAQARLRELEAGTTLTQAQTDVVAKAMRESQAALAMVTQERDALEKAADARQVAAVKHARAVAFEDCLRSVAAGRSAEETRALSSSPPSGQWVAADVMERVRAALDLALRRMANAYDALPIRDASEIFTAPLEHCRAALSALESEASR